MAHSFTNLLHHFVFSTKLRRPWLDESIRSQVFEFLGAGVRDEGFGTSLIVNGVADHAHMLVRLKPTAAPAAVMAKLKAVSSGWISKQFPAHRDFAWQPGYGWFSVSESQAPAVHKYIAGQEEHHRKMTFEEEYLELLRLHGIPFDPRYVFE